MSRFFALITAAAALAGLALSQSTDSPTKFEMADIHPTANNGGIFRIGAGIRPNGSNVFNGRYELRNATLVDMIFYAYGTDRGKILGGPQWLEWDQFDLTAKVPPDALSDTDAQKSMLKALLAERFHLVVHTGKKDLQAYTLTAGKNPKLKQSDDSGNPPGCRGQIGGPGATAMPGGGIRLNRDAGPVFIDNTCHNVTMEAFAKQLTPQVSQNGVISPVEDKTGLEGKWDFDYRTTLRLGPLAQSQGTSDNITIFDAVEKQLGLKLTPIQIPQEVLIVDKAEKPTPNAAGVSEALALKIPKMFEVADVRPVEVSPDGPRRIQITRGGAVNFSAMPLRGLITSAYEIDNNRLIVPPEMEKTLQTLYSVIAKPPASAAPATDGPAPAIQLPFGNPDDSDAAWTMMRELLKERFKLAMHQEDRTLTAWKLVAVKPKMKKADPSERTKMTNGPGPDGKDPRTVTPARQALSTFQNVSMDQFIEKITQIGSGLTTPVSNATGLDGGYDFTLNFSYQFALLGGGPGRGGPEPTGAPSNTAEAAEPTGAISFADALVEQLGLKLVEDKRPVSVWVIDHVESKPTDN
ncbi:MAG TPA: TIGR03435 family protein [Bryobacteraceae bacterium]